MKGIFKPMKDYKRVALALTALGMAAIYGGALAYPVDRPERGATRWIALPEAAFSDRENPDSLPREEIEIAASSVESLRAAFAEISFELKAIRQGQERVPRVFVTSLPGDFDRRMVIEQRKRTFVKTVLPLVLKANEEALVERRRLVALEERVSSGLELSGEAEAWLVSLSEKYGTAVGDFPKLLRRVDAVSPALALAQSIEESGWGRSRFARDGNALFGQRIWQSGGGLVPEARAADATFEVRAYDSLLDGVRAYVLNLNSHPAYTEFRAARAHMRAVETELDPFSLAESMTFYSERREAYVETLKGLIRTNRLYQFETVQLETGPVDLDGVQFAER